MRFARCLLACAAGLSLAYAPSARAAGSSANAAARVPIKQLQVRRLAEEPMRERAEKRARQRELRRLAKRMRLEGRTSLRVRGDRARPATGNHEAGAGVTRPARGATPLSAGAVTGPPRANQRCNNPLGDGSLDGQCETAIARWNNILVAAWNDGTGFTDFSNQTQGWGFSTDGGLTWTDQGKFPLPAGFPSWVWSSDPVLAVNPTTGAFYFSALADASPSLSAIGVLKGRFNGTTFAWGTVSVVRTVSSSADYLDKEWIAVDPATGKVCLSYTQFLSGLSRIDFQYADSALAAWSTPQVLSPPAENGAVQGSRPAIAGNGVIYVAYYLIGNVDVDYYRISRSLDGGQSFSAPVDAISFYSNFGSGAPGFNREMGIQFPSIAVDRSGGAHDGRIFLSWAESLNWYDDFPHVGSLGAMAEVEPNDTFSQATRLSVGQVASGSINASSEIYDYWSLPLAAGQSVVASADAAGPGVTITMRMFAPDGLTRLAFGQASDTEINAGFHPSWVFTAPAAGTYFLRVAGLFGGGTYRVATGNASRTIERGRDQRDVFVAYSDDAGNTWSAPVRASNSPVGFDDWLPEVAVTPDGQAYCAWYDWRDAPASTAGGESNVYLARSSDGGASWAELGATSDARTAWTAVQSNIIPNEGDYISLFADGSGVAVAWSDGRGGNPGNPDVYMSTWSLAEASSLPALLSATVSGGQVQLAWTVGSPAGFAAELYRLPSGSVTWDSLGTLFSDASGLMHYTDAAAQEGLGYKYRLGVMQGGTEYFYGQASVVIPLSNIGLALAGVWPNPMNSTKDVPVVTFTLANNGPATLDLLDLTGRRVGSSDLGAPGAGPHTVRYPFTDRPGPGVYFLRLKQAGVTRTRRVVWL